MKTRILRVIVPVICLLSAAAVFAQENAEGPFTQFANRLQWENEGELYWIDAFGPDTLRFRGSKSLRINDENWNLLGDGSPI